jgi:hypothetical protein
VGKQFKEGKHFSRMSQCLKMTKAQEEVPSVLLIWERDSGDSMRLPKRWKVSSGSI